MPTASAHLHQGTKSDVVSTSSEALILVDANDVELGFLDKTSCHDGGGVLHRAFSAFVFDDRGRVLIQKRSANKRLWPSYWSNSCCSHPRRGEAMGQAVRRRLNDELGIGWRQVPDLQFLYKFQYQASFGDVGSERELCWVFRAQLRGELMVNTTEIDDWAWIEPQALTCRLAQQADDFTPWLHLEWSAVQASAG